MLGALIIPVGVLRTSGVRVGPNEAVAEKFDAKHHARVGRTNQDSIRVCQVGRVHSSTRVGLKPVAGGAEPLEADQAARGRIEDRQSEFLLLFIELIKTISDGQGRAEEMGVGQLSGRGAPAARDP